MSSTRPRFERLLTQKTSCDVRNYQNPGTNTTNEAWPEIDIDDIYPLEEINYRSLGEIYPKLFNQRVKHGSMESISKQLQLVRSEKGIEALLHAQILNPINKVLEEVSPRLQRTIHFGPDASERTTSNDPDWTCSVQEGAEHYTEYCHLPGDTKSSVKFDPSLLLDRSILRNEWMRHIQPLRQVVHYAMVSRTRWTFIITEREVVIVKVWATKEDQPPTTRDQPARYQDQPRYSTQSGSSAAADSFGRMSIGSSYVPSLNRVYPEYVEMGIFPWQEIKHGLSGYGALLMTIIVATEASRHGIGAEYHWNHLPINLVIEIHLKPDKKGK